MATYQELRRLPELFCGFLRRARRGPTGYPVACSPQAWAAATPFALLTASLGLELDLDRNALRFNHPVLPRFLDEVVIRGLRVTPRVSTSASTGTVADVALNVLERDGNAGVLISK